MTDASIPRRRLLYGGALGLFAAGLLPAAAHADDGWHNIDVTGSSAPLEISMTRAGDGKQVSAADYKGRVVLLYFGYTYCPDVCPLTLTNLTHVLDGLGPLAQNVRILFVTVDPNRDTLPVLKEYAASFAPQIQALRGSQDALAALARRYRIAYSVTPSKNPRDYSVTHSSAIYVFDPTGAARLLIPSMASQSPDIDGTVADLRRLINGEGSPGLLSRILTRLRQLG
ncbi:MAG TPA: SCO family protein [Acetobacteraceae bacterium]